MQVYLLPNDGVPFVLQQLDDPILTPIVGCANLDVTFEHFLCFMVVIRCDPQRLLIVI